MRVYELAKQLNVATKDLIRKLELQGVVVSNHMMQLTEDQIKKLLNPSRNDHRRSASQGDRGRGKPFDRGDRNFRHGSKPSSAVGSSSSSSSRSSTDSTHGSGGFRSKQNTERSGDRFSSPSSARGEGKTFGGRPGGVRGPAAATPPLDFSRGARPGFVGKNQDKKRDLEKNVARKAIDDDHDEDILTDIIGADVAHDAPVKIQPVERKAMTVAEFSTFSGLPSKDVIVALLKQGIVAAKNKLLSISIIESLATQFNVELVDPVILEAQAQKVVDLAKQKAGDTRRAPVIVVVGHVDHGKTTLLDYIRKTRVASREKGGITQHLGAYRVSSGENYLTFLDTPGHEAFSLIRVRGITVADVAILVVAADDGVMPQTIESIKRLRTAGIPIVVALNKIDKASASQVETARRELTEQGVVPEDWGGAVPFVNISAKNGTGVQELLDLVVLQSELLDLYTHLDGAVEGVVLEAKMERGLGAVATVIFHQGTLKVGDHFIAGNAYGKVVSLRNDLGVSVKTAKPSEPVLVSGFQMLPEVGAVLRVVSTEEFRQHKQGDTVDYSVSSSLLNMADLTKDSVGPLIIIVRADNMSSMQAVIQSLESIGKKTYRSIKVINASVGPLTLKDVEFAKQQKAIACLFNAKIDKDAQIYVQRNGITVFDNDIIYHLLDAVQAFADKDRPIEKEWRKVGEASVLKVFDIKGIGIIAGAKVITGKIAKEGKLVVNRGKYKIGEGEIASLQKERKNVKEVLIGHECAFMIANYTDWQEDDRVECFMLLPKTA